VFPLIYTATLSGLENIDSFILDEVKMLSNSNIYIIKDIYLPLIYPYMLTSIIQSFGLGLKVLVMAEYLSQPKYSIGNELVFYKDLSVSMEYVYAWSIILVLFVLFFEFLLSQITKKLVRVMN
jgi:NitT/TauT family transport system permease protein